MSGSRLGLGRVFLYLLLALSIGVPAYAQGSFFSRLSGTVVDSEGLPIPGASVKVKNLGTNDEIDLVTGGDGTFTAQNIPGGKYSVIVELAGFRTTTLDSVSVSAGIPAAVKVTMQVGTIAENVTVVGDSATVVQSQSPAIATNLTGQQITSLPLTSRNALDSLTSLAGFNTSGAARSSTVSGLPRSAINITLDGMSVQDNYLKTTDGYFARLSPLLDSVEEVTVTTAGNTADATGQGAVQIRFVTKSGTNQWNGTGYEYLRHDALNANSWFRNRDLPPDPKTGKAPKNQLRQYTQGFAQGGPIKRDKAFFFFNYEERRSPSSSTLQRNILTPEAASGIFTYGSGLKQNLLQIAAANGQIATIDPTVGKILANIQSATTQSGGVVPLNNPLVQQYTWSTPTNNFDPAPTMRLDYELTKRHRLTGSFNYRHINSTPDTTNNAQLPFPNSLQTGSQQSTRWTTSESLRSTLGDSVFNEFRLGGSGGATLFSPEFATEMFSDTSGYRLNFNGACCGTGALLTNWSLGAGQSSREASTRVVENTTTWLKGNHNMQFGATMVQAMVWLANQTLVPTANFDIVAGEPADAIFNATSLPGASTTDITQAKRLYAMLTGRISSLTGDARINAGGDAYNLLGKSRAEGQMREFNLFVSDSWRASPSLTISAGLRYVLANPFYPTNDSYTTLSVASLYGVSGEGNVWKPGTLTGAKPQFVRYAKGEYAYNPDRNNIAPSVGAAWQVPPSEGFMKWLRGSEDGDVVLRAGWAMAFQRPGMSDFTGVFGDNQGISVSLNRDVNNSTLPAQPILLRNTPTLPGAPSVSLPAAPASITTRGNVYDPNIQMPYTQSWSAGWQRKITRDSAVEVRYVGSRHLNDWDSININEPNITTNGFLSEFRLAQANLQANIAAGRGATFAYMGAGTGTNPLPIFLAHFSGQNAANAGNATLYNSTQFTNATNLGFLAARNPNPWGFASPSASGLIGSATFRNNAIAAGLPVNFFVANPDLLGQTTGQAGAANLTMNSGGTRAHSMQVDFRKRFSHGFAINPSYTWSLAQIRQRFGFARPLEWIEQAGQVGNVRRALKANFSLEIPVGKERKFGGSMNSFLDTIVGGWSADGVARWQTGEVLDFGNVRLVGMTKSELQKEIKVQQGALGQIFILPADILDNTAKAFDVSATSATGYGTKGAPSGRYFAPANGPDCIEEAPGYGDCGERSITVNGPSLFRVDLGIAKKFDLPGRFTAEFRGEMLNAFNDPYFNPASAGGTPLGFTTTTTGPSGPGGGTPISNTTANNNVDNYRLTALLGDNQARLIQLVWRLRW